MGAKQIDQATLDGLNRSLTLSDIQSVRYQLGLMYEQGIGCVPDLVSADEWFLLGTAVGDARSRAESAALNDACRQGKSRKRTPDQMTGCGVAPSRPQAMLPLADHDTTLRFLLSAAALRSTSLSDAFQ